MILLVQNISLKIIKKDNKCYRRDNMKKTELKTIIREIVRKEVRIELRKFLKESKQAKLKQKSLKKEASTVYPKNKVLNEVLNETANTADEWETLGGKTLTTDSMQSILQKSYSGITGIQEDSSVMDNEMVADAGVTTEQVPDYIKNALSRDYSELMSTIDKKKNGVK